MNKRIWLLAALACGLLLLFDLLKEYDHAKPSLAKNTPFAQKEKGKVENESKDGENEREFIEEAFKQEFNKTKDPATNTVPRERLMQASSVANVLRASAANHRAIQGISWVERGPSIVGGRTRALIWDRRDATNNTIFAAGVAGGIWKATNISTPPPATPTWTKLTDVLDNIAVSCLIQDPNNYSILYAGTGETWGNGDALRGLGIWKSTDGGLNWKQLPSTNNSNFYYTQKIIITASGSVFAATSAGLKKSTDGGANWTNVLSGNFADMELAANGDLYAASLYGRVYKSPAASGGTTWNNISPAGTFARIEIATAPGDAQKLYLLCQGGADDKCDAIFRSDNGGTTWVSCPVPTIIDRGLNSNFCRDQAWYDLIATVDPNNANTVIIGGVDALKSSDGGASWNQMTTWDLFGAPAFSKIVHADQHAIVFAPGSSSRAVWGTDGGVYFTDQANITVTTTVKPNFDPKNDGYNVTQFYAAAIHPTAGSNYFLAGAQDNGSRKFNDGTPGIQQTALATGGDGAFCHIDQVDPTRQFTSYVYSVYYRSTDNGSTFSPVTNNQDRGSFINPTDYDPATQILYGDATTVSSGVGGAYGRWNTGGATLSFINVTQFNSASVTFVLVSPITSNRVYFGLNNGSVVYVDGANSGSPNKTGTIIKTGIGSVSGIAIEPGNENHMLVTYSNYGVTSVFESQNALGASPVWTNVEGNLPDMPVRWVIFKPGDYTKALLATELGVWTTDQLNGANTEWTPTNGGLANVRVDMLKVRTSDNTVVAATHGRGLFTTTFTNTTLPTINFQNRGTTVSETGTTSTTCGLGYRDVPVTLMLSNPVASAVTVSIDIDPSSTATLNQDYSLSANSITIPAGATQQSFNIRVLDDSNKELTESILLNYSITAGGSVAKKGTTFQNYQLDISDDEAAPTGPYTAQYTSGPYTQPLGASSPLQSTQSDKKIQYLYRASELSAIGLKPGPISSFYFTVGTKASTTPYNGFTIKMANVPATLTDLSAGFATASFTTVYTAPAGGFVPTMGENEFPISGFSWNGTSNILFEYCYDNSAVGTADDILLGEGTSFSSQARRTSTTTSDAGCGYTTGATPSTFRPVIVFSQPVPATGVATVVNTSKQAVIGPYETVHFFDASGNIVASVQNLDNWNYGCTTLAIDRDGTSAQQFQDNNTGDYVASKSVYFSPTTDNPAGNLQVTLYFTNAEKTGWETATGQSISGASLVKVKNAHISDVTPANPHIGDVSIGSGPNITQIGSSYAVSATFSNGLSGFGLASLSAPLPVTLLNFKGKVVNNLGVLEWTTTNETNSRSFEVERSINGAVFKKIGVLSAAGSSASIRNYSFTDPEALGPMQYYRLKLIDQDNRYTYSATVWLGGKNAAAFMVSPNPFSNYLDISFGETMNGKTEAVLLDASGRQILKNATELGGATKWRLYVNARLTKGVYLLKITGNGKTSSIKVVKSE